MNVLESSISSVHMPAPLAPTPIEQHRFHFLDALRGIAAIIVLLRHAPPIYAEKLISTNSFLAVDFFFCLSGFVIAHSYEKRLQGQLSLGRFFVTRLIRLYPLAFLGTLLGMLETGFYLHATAAPHLLGSLVSVATLGLLIVPTFSSRHPGDMLFPLDQVMWTLWVELLANLLYALLVRFRLASHMALGTLAVASLVLLVRAGLAAHTFNLGYMTTGAPVGLLRVGFSFFLGVLIFRLRRLQNRKQLSSKVSSITAFLICLAFVGALCNGPQWSSLPAQLLLLSLLFPVVIYLGALVTLSTQWNVVCAFLGMISYPLYILHVPLLWLLESKHFMHLAEATPQSGTLMMLGSIPILVAVAWAAGTYYDLPVRGMLAGRIRLAKLKPITPL